MSKEEASVSNHHQLPVEQVVTELGTNIESGLSNDEAKTRQEKFGLNQFASAKEIHPIVIFFKQFLSPIVALLAAASAVSFAFGDYTEGYAIVAVILINNITGFILEWQASRSVKALAEMDVIESNVIRQGQMSKQQIQYLTPGDLVWLDAGDVVPADGRLVKVNHLEINESALTGESMPVTKHTDVVAENSVLGDRLNMVYRGTNVVNGNGHFVVTGIGEKTELGKISDMINKAEEAGTPLEKRLNKITYQLIIITVIIGAIFLLNGFLQGKEWVILVETSIALAVAAIPEGLPIVATIALAYGMIRLARKNAIVKKLAAVETLGSTNMVFTDKTGTLTENNISVQEVHYASELYSQQKNQEEEEKLILIAALCNNASKNDKGVMTGDPLEIALLNWVGSFQRNPDDYRRGFSRIEEVPFNSDTKIMGTMHHDSGKFIATAKGAPESVISHCNLPDDLKQKVMETSEHLSSQGLRVLAFALRKMDTHQQDWFWQMDFCAVIGFVDPPRKDVDKVIETCHQAGIEVAMLTGDHRNTALYIARHIKIVKESEDKVITGQQMSEKAYDDNLLFSTRVFSRVSPGQKLDLVKSYQGQHYVVAMTGDGVNDAPALKQADIGIAMGKAGTQVAREASDIILKDDAFETIVYAIQQGRVIFRNIKKFMVFLISCNLSEILVIALLGVFNTQADLLPLQILFMNLITDVFPALALGMGEGDETIMKRKPLEAKAPLLDKHEWYQIVLYSVVLTAASILVYWYSSSILKLSPGLCNNIVFYSLALAQLIHVFNLSSPQSPVFNNEITRNKYVWGAVVICVLILISTYYVPLFRKVLSIEIENSAYLLIILVTSIIPLLVVQFLRRVLGIIKQ